MCEKVHCSVHDTTRCKTISQTYCVLLDSQRMHNSPAAGPKTSSETSRTQARKPIVIPLSVRQQNATSATDQTLFAKDEMNVPIALSAFRDKTLFAKDEMNVPIALSDFRDKTLFGTDCSIYSLLKYVIVKQLFVIWGLQYPYRPRSLFPAPYRSPSSMVQVPVYAERPEEHADTENVQSVSNNFGICLGLL